MDFDIGNDQRAGGTRTVCDLGLWRVGQVVGPEDWDALLELGDIVLCRTSDNWLSKTIASLDGYWTHSTIYVGGGKVAHASANGIGMVPLSGLAGYYEDCMGFARPRGQAKQREAAAAWARENSKDGGSYDGYDLGLAFALLIRARWRAAISRLPFLESMEEVHKNEPEGLEGLGPESDATCSGFVYKAYKYSGAELTIRPAPGIKLGEDDLLTVRDPQESDESLNSYLETIDVEALEELEMPSRDDLDRWMAVGRIVRSAAASSAIHALAGGVDQAIPVEQGVTPADLWCSPDIGDRGFLSSAFMSHAHNESSGCAETQTGEQSS